VLTAVVTEHAAAEVAVTGRPVTVTFPQWDVVTAEFVMAEEQELPEEDLNPIFPELKEIAWGFGSFVVFAVLMRYWLFPKLKKGMDRRYANIREDFEAADATKASAQHEVAQYEAQVAAAKAEANARIEAARQVLEGERQARLTEVNARIADKRAAAAAELEAAREAARPHIEAAVADVAGRAGELATGRRPSDAVVQSAVADVMSAGGAR
jgi:F-type H+-transporting ATPase subunit b